MLEKTPKKSLKAKNDFFLNPKNYIVEEKQLDLPVLNWFIIVYIASILGVQAPLRRA